MFKIGDIIILSGGKSSRFGKDKRFLKINGKPMIEYMTEKALQAVSRNEHVILSTKTTLKLPKLEDERIIIVYEIDPTFSPLVGFKNGLDEVKTDQCLLLACDMPFVTPETIKYLFYRAKDHSSAIPKWNNGFIEPLCAVYATNETRKAINDKFNMETASFRQLISKLSCNCYVSIEHDLPNVENQFLNVNTIADWKQIEKMIVEKKKIS